MYFFLINKFLNVFLNIKCYLCIIILYYSNYKLFGNMFICQENNVNTKHLIDPKRHFLNFKMYHYFEC